MQCMPNQTAKSHERPPVVEIAGSADSELTESLHTQKVEKRQSLSIKEELSRNVNEVQTLAGIISSSSDKVHVP